MVIRRPGRSGRRHSPRTEPVARADCPAGPRGRAGGRSRRVPGLVVRPRALQVLRGVGHRVPRPDVADPGRPGVLVPGAAPGPAGVGREGCAVPGGARAVARRERAERPRGDQAGGPHRQPRLLTRPRRSARALGGGTLPGPRSGVGGRAAEDPAVVELSGPRLRRRPSRLHPRTVLSAARGGGPDGPRRGPRRGQPLQHARGAGRRHHRPRGGSHGDRPALRVRDERRQPVHAKCPRGAVGAGPADSAGDSRRRPAAPRRVRDGALRHPGRDRLLRRRGRRALGDVHRRRHRPALRRPPRARIPLSRLHRARAAPDPGRRGHRGSAGDRGAHAGVSDHGHPGRAAGVRRDLGRRADPPR